jgi:hypothetical protein
MDDSDWDIAGELVDRLAEKDPPSPKDEPEVQSAQERRIERDIQKERDEKRQNTEHRERTIKSLVEQAHQKAAAKEYYKAPALKGPDADLRAQIKNSIDFHQMPLADQQSFAANMRNMEEIQKWAVELGLKKP